MTVSVLDGCSRLHLTRAGDPEPGYPVSSYPTEIEVNSGTLSAATKAAAQNYATFVEELSKLYESMAGEATLRFWNEAHSIVLTGNGRGRIAVTVTITEGLSASLRVVLALDQSHLPAIISALKDEFAI